MNCQCDQETCQQKCEKDYPCYSIIWNQPANQWVKGKKYILHRCVCEEINYHRPEFYPVIFVDGCDGIYLFRKISNNDLIRLHVGKDELQSLFWVGSI